MCGDRGFAGWTDLTYPTGRTTLRPTGTPQTRKRVNAPHTGKQLGNRVLQTEARATVIDGYLAVAVLVGLVLNAAAGLWWADPLAAFVIVFYGLREGAAALHEARA
jgi:hypothetical protein